MNIQIVLKIYIHTYVLLILAFRPVLLKIKTFRAGKTFKKLPTPENLFMYARCRMYIHILGHPCNHSSARHMALL